MMKWSAHTLVKRRSWYRKGFALKCLDRHCDALVAYANGLIQDPNNQQLMNAMLEAVNETDMKESVQSTYNQLRVLGLEKSPFVLVSVIGQEVLAAGQLEEAITILEAALQIGTTSLKLRQSVVSALANAYWSLGKAEQATSFMNQDLAVAKSLGDSVGELRAYKNLGMAHLAANRDQEALNHYRHMLSYSVKLSDQRSLVSALSSLGRVYSRLGDFTNAVASHEQCIQAMQPLPSLDQREIARENGYLGNAFLDGANCSGSDSSTSVELARDAFLKQLSVGKMCSDVTEQARAYANLGKWSQRERATDEALKAYSTGMKLAKHAKDRVLEGTLCGHLCGLYRSLRNIDAARKWAEKELQISLLVADHTLEAQACSDLGLVHHAMGNVENALKLHRKHFEIASKVNDRSGRLKAAANLGHSFIAQGHFDQALKFFKISLSIARELGDRIGEAEAHGNLAQVSQLLSNCDQARIHLNCQLSLARTIGSIGQEAKAQFNMGQFYVGQFELRDGMQCFERFLMLAQEQNDVESERKACHCLGKTHGKMEQYREAIRYFDQELALAKDLRDHSSMAQVYCDLGLAHVALGQLDDGLECHKYYLALAHITKNAKAKFEALKNIGDVLVLRGSYAAALKVYSKQLTLAKISEDRNLESDAFWCMGKGLQASNQLDKAMAHFTQQFAIADEIGYVRGQYDAQGSIGQLFEQLSKFPLAIRAYEQQVDLARKLNDVFFEATAIGRSASVCVKLELFEDAIRSFEEQVSLLRKLPAARTYRVLIETYESLGAVFLLAGRPTRAIAAYEEFLMLTTGSSTGVDQDDTDADLQEPTCSTHHDQPSDERLEKAYHGICLALIHSQCSAADLLESCQRRVDSIDTSKQQLLQDHSTAPMVTTRLVDALCTLAYAHCLDGDFDNAHRDIDRALRLIDQRDDFFQSDTIRLLREKSILFLLESNEKSAIKLLSQATEMAEKQQDPMETVLCHLIMSRIHEHTGALQEAKDELTMTLNELSNATPDYVKLKLRISLARVSVLLGEDAKSELDEASTLGHLLKSNLQTAEISYLRALQHCFLCDYETAESTLVDALDAYKASKSTKISFDLPVSLDDVALYDPLATLRPIFRLLMVLQNACGAHSEMILTAERHRTFANQPNRSTLVEFDQLYPKSRAKEIIADAVIDDATRYTVAVVQIETILFSSVCYKEKDDDVILTSIGMLTGELDRSAARISNQSIVMTDYERKIIADIPTVHQVACDNLSRIDLLRQAIGPQLLQPLSTVDSARGQVVRVVCGSELVSLKWEFILSPSGNLPYFIEFALCPLRSDTKTLADSLLHSTVAAFGDSREAMVVNLDAKMGHLTANSLASTINAEFVDVGGAEDDLVDLGRWCAATRLLHLHGARIDVEGNLVLERSGPSASPPLTPLVDDADADMCMDFEAPKSEADSAEDNLPLNIALSSLCRLKLNCETVIVALQGGFPNARSYCSLVQCLLTAGAQHVVVNLEPVSLEMSSNFVKHFYKYRLGHLEMTPVLCVAAVRADMKMGQVFSVFKHTASVAASDDVMASHLVTGGGENRVFLGPALRSILDSPEECREALKILHHLMDKSLKRICAGEQKPMYTSEESVRHKVGPEVTGWRELLGNVGFTFTTVDDKQQPGAMSLMTSSQSDDRSKVVIYFPLVNYQTLLQRAATLVQALLSLPQTCIIALEKVKNDFGNARNLIDTLGSIGTQLAECSLNSFESPFNLEISASEGVRELFASLGFDVTQPAPGLLHLNCSRVHLTSSNVQALIEVIPSLFDDKIEEPRGHYSIDTSKVDGRMLSSFDNTYAKVNALIGGENMDQLPSPVQRELARLKNIDLSASLNGFESDVWSSGNMMKSGHHKRKLPREAKRGSKSTGNMKAALGGYVSEDEGRARQRRTQHLRSSARSGGTEGGMKGYHSEDETKRNAAGTLSKSGSLARFNDELMESTARVIAIEENSDSMMLSRINSASVQRLAPSPMVAPVAAFQAQSPVNVATSTSTILTSIIASGLRKFTVKSGSAAKKQEPVVVSPQKTAKTHSYSRPVLKQSSSDTEAASHFVPPIRPSPSQYPGAFQPEFGIPPAAPIPSRPPPVVRPVRLAARTVVSPNYTTVRGPSSKPSPPPSYRTAMHRKANGNSPNNNPHQSTECSGTIRESPTYVRTSALVARQHDSQMDLTEPKESRERLGPSMNCSQEYVDIISSPSPSESSNSLNMSAAANGSKGGEPVLNLGNTRHSGSLSGSPTRNANSSPDQSFDIIGGQDPYRLRMAALKLAGQQEKLKKSLRNNTGNYSRSATPSITAQNEGTWPCEPSAPPSNVVVSTMSSKVMPTPRIYVKPISACHNEDDQNRGCPASMGGYPVQRQKYSNCATVMVPVLNAHNYDLTVSGSNNIKYPEMRCLKKICNYERIPDQATLQQRFGREDNHPAEFI